MTDYRKEYARQMRENAVKDRCGRIICDPVLWEEIATLIENVPTDDTNDLESLRAKCKELKYALDRANDEKSKIGVMYEELLKEKKDLEMRIEFLNGQNDAYRYVVCNTRR